MLGINSLRASARNFSQNFWVSEKKTSCSKKTVNIPFMLTLKMLCRRSSKSSSTLRTSASSVFSDSDSLYSESSGHAKRSMPKINAVNVTKIEALKLLAPKGPRKRSMPAIDVVNVTKGEGYKNLLKTQPRSDRLSKWEPRAVNNYLPEEVAVSVAMLESGKLSPWFNEPFNDYLPEDVAIKVAMKRSQKWLQVGYKSLNNGLQEEDAIKEALKESLIGHGQDKTKQAPATAKTAQNDAVKASPPKSNGATVSPEKAKSEQAAVHTEKANDKKTTPVSVENARIDAPSVKPAAQTVNKVSLELANLDELTEVERPLINTQGNNWYCPSLDGNCLYNCFVEKCGSKEIKSVVEKWRKKCPEIEQFFGEIPHRNLRIMTAFAAREELKSIGITEPDPQTVYDEIMQNGVYTGDAEYGPEFAAKVMSKKMLVIKQQRNTETGLIKEACTRNYLKGEGVTPDIILRLEGEHFYLYSPDEANT